MQGKAISLPVHSLKEKKILADACFKKHAPRTKRAGIKSKAIGTEQDARMMIPAVGQRAGIMGPQKAQVELSGPLLDPYLLVTWVPYEAKSFALYGGDDGARTRDLCRDRAAL